MYTKSIFAFFRKNNFSRLMKEKMLPLVNQRIRFKLLAKKYDSLRLAEISGFVPFSNTNSTDKNKKLVKN